MSAAARRERLVELVGPVAREAGFDLEDVSVTPAGKRRILRIVVDKDGGVTADETSALTETVSRVLDQDDAMGSGPYVLEVTSPGTDRPLTEPRHWRRAVGRLVRVQPAAGQVLTARVVSADSSTVVLDADGRQRGFSYAELGPGRVELEFNRDDGDRSEEGPQWTST